LIFNIILIDKNHHIIRQSKKHRLEKYLSLNPSPKREGLPPLSWGRGIRGGEVINKKCI